MNKAFLGILGAFAVLACAPAYATPAIPAVATPVAVLTLTFSDYFYYTTDIPGVYISGVFGATDNTASNGFNYDFNFHLPVSGTGSGNLGTNISSAYAQITITKVIVDGVDVSSYIIDNTNGQSLNIPNFPIGTNSDNTIEVEGYTGPSTLGGQFTGGFTYTAVPEPATWTTFLLGFGFLGFALRRKTREQLKTA